MIPEVFARTYFLFIKIFYKNRKLLKQKKFFEIKYFLIIEDEIIW